MKTMMRTLVIALVALFAFQAPVSAIGDKPITVSELPSKAQSIVKQYFKGKDILLVKMDNDIVSKSYEVVFATGEELEFNGSGEWTKIECKRSSVPTSLVPQAIRSYVSKNYSGAKIVEIEKERSQYEVKLSNGLELTFNKKFQVVDIDT